MRNSNYSSSFWDKQFGDPTLVNHCGTQQEAFLGGLHAEELFQASGVTGAVRSSTSMHRERDWMPACTKNAKIKNGKI